MYTIYAEQTGKQPIKYIADHNNFQFVMINAK